MARNTEVARTKLVLDNEEARKSIKELTDDLTELKKRRREALKAGDVNAANSLDGEIKKIDKELRQLGKEVVDVDEVLKNLNKVSLNELNAAFRKQNAHLKTLERDTEEYKQALEKVNRLKNEIDTTKGGASSSFNLKKFLGLATIITAVSAGLKKVFSDMIEVRKEFEKYEAVLKNTLGSTVLMRQSMAMLRDFAQKTPYSLSELVGGFNKLVNQGFRPTREEMESLGDLASSQGKSFDQLVEAIIDAQTGEFERLKEFGIRASKQGDKVMFTFKGVKTQVDFTSDSIRKYILGLGDAEGVSGTMAQVSETMGGKISNAGDAWEGLMNTLGSRTGGVVNWVIDKFIGLIETMDNVVQSFDQIKMKVMDNQAISDKEGALDEIRAMTESGIRQGMNKNEAEARAIRLYEENMEDTIMRLRNKLAFASDEEKKRINETILMRKQELELVKDHYRQLNKIEEKPTGKKTGKKQWTPEQDAQFMTERIALRQRLMDGEIATEDDFSRQLLALEIASLERRIEANKEKGTDLQRLQDQLAEKRYQRQKADLARQEQLKEMSLRGGRSDSKKQQYDQEEYRYGQEKKKAGLDKEQLTAEEHKALEGLERAHIGRMQAIYMDGLTKEYNQKKSAADREITALRLKHNEELAAADTLEKKKALIDDIFHDDRSKKIKTEKEAEKVLKEHYALDEQAAAKKEYEELIAIYQQMMAEVKDVTDENIHLGTLSEDDIAKIQGYLDELRAKLAELDKTASGSKDESWRKVDVLGFTADSWDTFFKNLKAGKAGIQEWQMALQAVGNAFGHISQVMTAAENRELKKYEQTANKKKKVLERELAQKKISQEQYSSAVEQLDADVERKREETERKQAVRDKATAVFNSLIATGVAVAQALPNIPLSITVGALGAIQTAAILATPLPGKEEGGWLDVEREQDGRHYRAKVDPSKRGYVSAPTVLVGEGPEYVVPTDGYENPTIRPVLDIIEQARRAGTLRTIDLPAVLGVTASGRAAGGFVDPSPDRTPTTPSGSVAGAFGPVDPEILAELLVLMRKLNRRLDKPLDVRNSAGGRHGIVQAIKNYERIRDNANF